MTSQQFQQAIELTNAMLRFAEQEEWEQVIQLEQVRATLLKDMFPSVREAQVEAQYQPMLDQLIEANKKLEQLSSKAFQQIKSELTTLNKQKKAATAYQSR